MARFRFARPLVCALLLVRFAPAAADAPQVVVSIAPVHSLVAGVMAGVGVPRLLVQGGRSPHSYALRPSDARALAAAALVVWVGPQLEPHVGRAIAAHAPAARVVTLAVLPAIRLLPARRGGVYQGGRDRPDRGHDQAADRPDRADPHVWLSPDNARVIAAAAADALGRADPGHAAVYAANAKALAARIAALDAELRRLLAPVRGTPYLVFHDAYQYFERHYGLSPLGAVAVSPERAPGARRIAELRREIASSGARCLFREPQFPPRVLDTLRAGTALRIGVLDPLGAALAPGPDLWFQLMRDLGRSLAACAAAGG